MSESTNTTIEELEIELIVSDRRLQPRTEVDAALIRSYEEDLVQGASFPPIRVIRDGKNLWMVDGYHRFWAHKRRNRKTIRAEVSEGTFDDALLLSAGVNGTHGKRRSNGDIQRAVWLLLDYYGAHVAVDEIARRIQVSQSTVYSYRRSWDTKTGFERTQRRTVANGQEYYSSYPKHKPKEQLQTVTTFAPATSDSYETAVTQVVDEPQPEEISVRESSTVESPLGERQAPPPPEPSAPPEPPSAPPPEPMPARFNNLPEELAYKFALRELRQWRGKWGGMPAFAGFVDELDAIVYALEPTT